MALKRTQSDILFSKCIRERSDWTCEKCGAKHPENSRGLECSHFHGRGKWGVRFDPDNCLSLCTACHFYVGAHPSFHREFYLSLKGQGMFDILQEKANDTRLGRMAKRAEAEIRKHYRTELERMKELRAQGVTGRIEFENWA